ncbi:MAG: DUF2066 domain-containing protein [Magnetococcales bacterium]|nr:DUF2066 domain-containing protein [Magnetococcales bacterium]
MNNFSGLGHRFSGWWLIALWIVTLMPCRVGWSAAAAESGNRSIYEVGHVEISLPLGGKNVDAMQEAGVAQAQREGLQRLFKRMLTSQEREARKAFLAGLLKESKRLTERTVVRSKKQVGDRLDMTVDLFFSRKEVSAALVKEGIPHGEMAYPPALLIAREEATEGPSTWLWKTLPTVAREHGIVLLQPLGDVEDFTHLNWDKAAKGDAEVLNWASTRYGASDTWVVKAESAPLTASKGGARLRVSGTLVVSRANSAPITFQAREEKSGATPEEIATALYPLVAGKLVQQAVEHWLAGHVVQPGLKHQLRLRVIHEAQLARLTEFLNTLKAIPGVKDPQVLQATARETHFSFEYQGRDDLLEQALAKRVVHQEKNAEGLTFWLVTPPKTPAAASIPPAPVETAPSASSQPAAKSPAPVVPGSTAPSAPSQPAAKSPAPVVPGSTAPSAPSQPAAKSPAPVVPGSAAPSAPSQPAAKSPAPVVPGSAAPSAPSQPAAKSPAPVVPVQPAAKPPTQPVPSPAAPLQPANPAKSWL